MLAYNAIGLDGERTYGGYSQKIVVDERFAVRIPDAIPLANAAPLFCAGITLYSPLKHWNAGPGKRVAIVGFGGLGHVGVQISKALGAHTTVLDLSEAKRADAMRLGADAFWLASEPDVFDKLANAFDLIISTVPSNVDLDAYVGLLAVDGTYVHFEHPRQAAVGRGCEVACQPPLDRWHAQRWFTRDAGHDRLLRDTQHQGRRRDHQR